MLCSVMSLGCLVYRSITGDTGESGYGTEEVSDKVDFLPQDLCWGVSRGVSFSLAHFLIVTRLEVGYFF